MKRFCLTVLALGLALSGCAQNKGKTGQEAAQASKMDSLEASFSRYQEQQRARDADIDYKLREIAARLDRLNQGQPVPSKYHKGKEAKPVPVAASRQPAAASSVVAGQVIPYSSLTPASPVSAPVSAPGAAPVQAQGPAAAPAASAPSPQPMPALQPPVVTLGEAARVAPATAAPQARQPMPMTSVESGKHGKGKQSARTPQPVSQAAQPAVVAQAAPAVAAAAPASPAPAGDVQEQQLYTDALRAVSANRNDEGRKKFNDFLSKYPNSSKSPEALYWIGESYMGDKSYNQAILGFKEVVNRYPKAPKSAEALYRIADAYERLGDKANASFHLKMLTDEHPNSEFSGKAKQKLKQLGQ